MKNPKHFLLCALCALCVRHIPAVHAQNAIPTNANAGWGNIYICTDGIHINGTLLSDTSLPTNALALGLSNVVNSAVSNATAFAVQTALSNAAVAAALGNPTASNSLFGIATNSVWIRAGFANITGPSNYWPTITAFGTNWTASFSCPTNHWIRWNWQVFSSPLAIGFVCDSNGVPVTWPVQMQYVFLPTQ
jgi:hypothetical protein